MVDAIAEKALRVAFLCPRFLMAHGGAETLAGDLAEALANRGIEMTVICAEVPGKIPRGPEGVAIRSLRRDERRERLWRRLANLDQIRGFYRVGRVLQRDGRITTLGKGPHCPEVSDSDLFRDYDVVLLFGFNTSWEVLFGQVAGCLGTAVSIACPLLHVREPGAALPVHMDMVRHFDHVVTLTAFEKEFLVSGGIGANRITPIPVGSRFPDETMAEAEFRERRGIPCDVPIVLFLGRKIFNKGVPHLIQAMDEVWDVYPSARLVLFGFPQNDPEWLKGYLLNSRHDATNLMINIDDGLESEREGALAACAVMAMPSISDSFGIAYVDAWRHAKPVIGCSNTCCESFIEDGLDGHLVEFGNIQQIARAIMSVLGDPATAGEMGARGKEKWEKRFQWAAVAEQSEALYRRLVSGARDDQVASL